MDDKSFVRERARSFDPKPTPRSASMATSVPSAAYAAASRYTADESGLDGLQDQTSEQPAMPAEDDYNIINHSRRWYGSPPRTSGYKVPQRRRPAPVPRAEDDLLKMQRKHEKQLGLNANAAPIIQATMRGKLSEVDQRVRALRDMHDQIVELQDILMQLIEDQKKRLAAMPQGFVDFDTLETMRQGIMAFIVKGVKHLSADDDELEARVAELETAARQPKFKSDISCLEERLAKLEAANAELVREKKGDRETITRLNDKVVGLTTTVTELSRTVADQEEVVQLARAALEAPDDPAV